MESSVSDLFRVFKKHLAGMICSKHHCEASCHLLTMDIWHCFLLCWNTKFGAIFGPVVRLSVVTMWRSNTYRLLPMCHVYLEVRIKLSAWRCLLPYFLILRIHYSSNPHTLTISELCNFLRLAYKTKGWVLSHCCQKMYFCCFFYSEVKTR